MYLWLQLFFSLINSCIYSNLVRNFLIRQINRRCCMYICLGHGTFLLSLLLYWHKQKLSSIPRSHLHTYCHSPLYHNFPSISFAISFLRLKFNYYRSGLDQKYIKCNMRPDNISLHNSERTNKGILGLMEWESNS